MKRMLISSTVALLISQSAMANESSIKDLMYLPKAGTLTAGVGFSYTMLELDTDVNSLDYSDAEVDTANLEARFSYAVTDNFLFRIDLPYQLNSSDTTTYGEGSVMDGQSEKTESSGVENFDLNVRARVVNQADSGIDFDLLGTFSPNLGDGEIASTKNDANALRGSAVAEIGFELGKKIETVQLSANFLYSLNGEAKVRSLEDNSKMTVEKHSDISIGGSALYSLSEQLFLEGSLGMTILGDYDVVSDGTTMTYKNDTAVSVEVGAGFLLSKNTMIEGSFGLGSFEREITTGSTTLEQEVTSKQFKFIFAREF